jgi:hypothetical protein
MRRNRTKKRNLRRKTRKGGDPKDNASRLTRAKRFASSTVVPLAKYGVGITRGILKTARDSFDHGTPQYNVMNQVSNLFDVPRTNGYHFFGNTAHEITVLVNNKRFPETRLSPANNIEQHNIHYMIRNVVYNGRITGWFKSVPGENLIVNTDGVQARYSGDKVNYSIQELNEFLSSIESYKFEAGSKIYTDGNGKFVLQYINKDIAANSYYSVPVKLVEEGGKYKTDSNGAYYVIEKNCELWRNYFPKKFPYLSCSNPTPESTVEEPTPESAPM